MSTDVAERVRRTLRAIPDHPKPGIVFQDITPVLHNARLFAAAVDAMAAPFREAGVTMSWGSRRAGHHGSTTGDAHRAGFIPQPGKLPWESVAEVRTRVWRGQPACAPGYLQGEVTVG
jgi:adenine phosphoribosyltransferase